MYDAVIVGASVAGSASAIELARRGLRVALLDRARFPRPKACGEGLLPHGVEALAALGVEVPGVPVRGLRFVAPDGSAAEADFPRGHGLVVRRDRFDALLFRAAAATPGVEAFEGTPYDPARWRARWIVGADGLHSIFHRHAELRAAPAAPRRVGLATHARGLEVDRERVEVLFHAGGEVYLAPSAGGEAMVACLARAGALPRAATNEERVASILGSVEALRGRIRGLAFTTPVLAAGPLGLRVRAPAAGDVVLVGDAAGAPDPVTGEGMSLALLSARAAAEAIARGDPEAYARERARLAAGADWLGRWILRAARHPALAGRVVRSLAGSPATFRKLLEIATGERAPGDLTLGERAALVISRQSAP
jgi:flavin-dependent dehydrogenase